LKLDIKICGLRDTDSVAAAVEGGARYLGFNFYPKSPRWIETDKAAALITWLPERMTSVGLFVDPSDEDIRRVVANVPLRMIQLHGTETPERVNAVKNLTGMPVIKASGIAAAQDIAALRRFEAVADLLLLDAKPPAGAVPGGNAVRFDWNLLKEVSFAKPWMLAGGLNESNMAEAVAVTSARLLDVSSGVESALGRKDPVKIRAFLDKARQIETCC
jgi:phosphoribosylanthranilate isomerase